GAVLVYNGEIYNHAELRDELRQRGVRFAERSDTEVVLHAYDTWGDDFVRALRGMFALAIWDPRRNRLIAARDRLGIKPFYYHWDGTTFSFASELKALTAIKAFPLDIDQDSFDAYLRLQYVPAPRTIFRNVRQLLPGRLLTIDVRGQLDER